MGVPKREVSFQDDNSHEEVGGGTSVLFPKVGTEVQSRDDTDRRRGVRRRKRRSTLSTTGKREVLRRTSKVSRPGRTPTPVEVHPETTYRDLCPPKEVGRKFIAVRRRFGIMGTAEWTPSKGYIDTRKGYTP